MRPPEAAAPRPSRGRHRPASRRRMAWFGRGREPVDKPKGPILVVEGLDVYYGRAHALQGVSLSIDKGVLGIVGRNGMGKTTLCNAITGLVPASGSVRLAGEEILGRPANEITKRGIAYVPQGRRVWPSLTVDETLRLVAPNTPRHRACVFDVPAPGRTQEQRRRAAVGRRTADAGHRARAAAAAASCW